MHWSLMNDKYFWAHQIIKIEVHKDGPNNSAILAELLSLKQLGSSSLIWGNF